MRTVRRAMFLTGAAAGLVGCYSYVPVAAPAPPPGAQAAVELTDQGTATLGAQVGPGAGELEGSVVAVTDTALVLGLRLVRQRGGAETDWRGERVIVPRAVIAAVRERRFSRTRSTLFAVATVAGAALVGRAFGVGGESILHGRGSGGGSQQQ